MSAMCFHNGRYAPLEECCLPVTDLIIQRGVGVFESIRTYGGRTFAASRHLDRLAESAKQCGMRAEKIIEMLPSIIKDGVAHPSAPKPEMLIKPFVTGGKINQHGVFPEPDFFVIFEELHTLNDSNTQAGIELEPNFMERPLPRIKTTSYVAGLIALRGGSENVFEALYCPNGEITESMASNFFLCLDGTIITAPLDRVLRGVTRDIVLTLARENGFKIEERCPRWNELALAQEAFITGSLKEVLPVIRIGRQIIGGGNPGPVAKHLHRLFMENINRWIDK